MSKFDRVRRETGWVDLNVPRRPRRAKQWQILLGLLLPAFMLWVAVDYLLTPASAEAQAPQAAPTRSAEQPPAVPECQTQVVGDICYILQEDGCMSDCPAGMLQVVGDPPAIKPLPAKKVTKPSRTQRSGHPKRAKPPPPPSPPPPKPTAPFSGPGLPA